MMTQMTSFSPSSPFGSDGPLASAETPASVRLKRVGQRPLVFEGEELCMAMSYIPGAPLWYEIDVWQTRSGGFVTAVKQFHRDEERTDTCRAWEHEDFEEAMAVLEAYDPAMDLILDADPAADAPAAEIASAALQLRSRLAEARRQYHSLLGEILYDLEHG